MTRHKQGSMSNLFLNNLLIIILQAGKNPSLLLLVAMKLQQESHLLKCESEQT